MKQAELGERAAIGIVKRLAGAALAGVAALALGWSARAATGVVTKLLDDGSTGTLRKVIAAANPGDTITFGVTGSIVLTRGQIGLSKNLIISGPGTGALALSGNNVSPIFLIDPNVNVQIAGLTIKNGLGSTGGGINNYGAVTVIDSRILSNTASGYGVGIVNYSALTVTNSTLLRNTALTSGGGVHNRQFGSAVISGSVFVSNTATNCGGGIYNEGALAVTHSAFNANKATELVGGDIANIGTLSVNNSALTANKSMQSNAGGLFNTGPLTVISSAFTANTAAGAGGGILSNQGAVTVTGPRRLRGEVVKTVQRPPLRLGQRRRHHRSTPPRPGTQYSTYQVRPKPKILT